MVAEMKEDLRRLALHQYRLIPALIGESYDPDTEFQVLNHLLDREQMERDIDLRPELEKADSSLADALGDANSAWREHLASGAALCGFSASLWWITVWYRAQRRIGCDVGLPDVLRGHADSWFHASGSEHADVGIAGATTKIMKYLNDAMRSLVDACVETMSGQPPPELAKLSRLDLRVAVPGSIVLGLGLPRQTADEPASPPHELSVQALDRLIEAGRRFDPARSRDDIADLVQGEQEAEKVWGALRGLYRIGVRAGGTIRLQSTVPQHQDGFQWDVDSGPALRKKVTPRQRRVTICGNVRAVDLDRCLIKLRVPESGWATEVVAERSLFLDPTRFAERLGLDLTVTGHTYETRQPPRRMTALDFDD